jgi:hypothetical protein
MGSWGDGWLGGSEHQGEGQEAETGTQQQGQAAPQATDPIAVGRFQPAEAAVSALVAMEQVQGHRQPGEPVEPQGDRAGQGRQQGRELAAGVRTVQPQLEQMHHQEHQQHPAAPGRPAGGQGRQGFSAPSSPAAQRSGGWALGLAVAEAAEQGQGGVKQQRRRQQQLRSGQPDLLVQSGRQPLETAGIDQGQRDGRQMGHQEQRQAQPAQGEQGLGRARYGLGGQGRGLESNRGAPIASGGESNHRLRLSIGTHLDGSTLAAGVGRDGRCRWGTRRRSVLKPGKRAVVGLPKRCHPPYLGAVGAVGS